MTSILSLDDIDGVAEYPCLYCQSMDFKPKLNGSTKVSMSFV